MILGGTPTTAAETNLPSIGRDSLLAIDLRARRTAAAPSETWEALPACVEPVLEKAGFNLARDSGVTSSLQRKKGGGRNHPFWEVIFPAYRHKTYRPLGGPYAVVLGYDNFLLLLGLRIRPQRLYGNNLAVEFARLLSGRSLGKRLRSESVLGLARDAELGCHVFAGDSSVHCVRNGPAKEGGRGGSCRDSENSSNRADLVIPIGKRESAASGTWRTCSDILEGMTPAP
jgi:hypothetical protein